MRSAATRASRCSRSRSRWPVSVSAAALEQPQQDQLLEHRRAEVEADPGVGEPVDQVVRRPHPAEPQAAPEALAGAADGDRARGERRERPRHRLALERQRLVRLVDDRDRARGADVRGVRLPLLVAHQQAGGVLEVRDQVGQPRRGLPQRGARPRRGPSRPGRRARRRAGRRCCAAPRSRWGRPATRPAPGRPARRAPWPRSPPRPGRRASP